MVCRAWTAYLVEVKQQRAGQEADQQQLAEQHHRQVLIRGLWEGLGQALALRRTAQHDAHRHYQLCRQRLVSVKTEAHIQPLARRPGIFPPSRYIVQCPLGEDMQLCGRVRLAIFLEALHYIEPWKMQHIRVPADPCRCCDTGGQFRRMQLMLACFKSSSTCTKLACISVGCLDCAVCMAGQRQQLLAEKRLPLRLGKMQPGTRFSSGWLRMLAGTPAHKPS